MLNAHTFSILTNKIPVHLKPLYCFSFYLRIVVIVLLCSWSGRPSGPTTNTAHDYHHDTKVKPEADTAVIELLMMGGKTPETCSAVNKRQDNKLENCCIRLVIYLNWIQIVSNFFFVNNQLDANSFSCMFLSILYTFRAAMCPSSGELIVSIRHLVYVSLHRWPFGVQSHSNLHTKRSSIQTDIYQMSYWYN